MSGRSCGRGNDNLLQYSCLENSMDRGAWRVTVHGVTKSQTRLSTRTHARAHTHTHTRTHMHTHIPPWGFQDLSQDQSSGCLHFPLVFKEKNMDCVKQSGKKFILSGLNGLCSLKIIQAQKGKAYFDRMGKQIEEKAGKHSIEWREKEK